MIDDDKKFYIITWGVDKANDGPNYGGTEYNLPNEHTGSAYDYSKKDTMPVMADYDPANSTLGGHNGSTNHRSGSYDDPTRPMPPSTKEHAL